ncbi:MAG: hypothetical protein AB1555_17485 [Nitrospirota bacterium]
MRPKVKFLVTVWGDSYIKRFLSLALPSYLASGNLPALAGSTELEVVILTSKDDITLFEADSAFKRVSGLCRTRFIPINDLITSGCYGVTLTLAYGRAIISLGEGMRNTHFIFMNADFVLADGSLQSLIGHILDGRKVVLAPSFRAVVEEIGPRLKVMVDREKGTLTITPRQLVRLALEHNHPTNIAKTVNQSFCHMVNPNQFFWQIDEKTVIGRHFLVFPLCLKPERVISKINSYCDYGFIPELCPSEDMVVLHDSDDIFMLELAALDQESHLIRVGRQLTAKEIASSLSEWTTYEHRKLARQTLVFHAGDLPLSLEAVLSEANDFMYQLERDLTKPESHKFHRYWISGVQYWRELRRRQCQPDDVPEIENGPINLTYLISGSLSKLTAYGKRLLLGYPPCVRPWHYAWHDYHQVRKLVSEMLGTTERIVFVSNSFNPMGSLLSRIDHRSQLQHVTLQELFASPNKFVSSSGSCEPVHYFCYLSKEELHLVGKIIDTVRQDLSKSAELVLFADNLSTMGQGDLVKLVSSITANELRRCSVSFVGGRLKNYIAWSVSALTSAYARGGVKSLPFVAPAFMLLLVVSALNNVLLILAGNRRRGVTRCSSILIRVDFRARYEPTWIPGAQRHNRNNPVNDICV